jgi:hypothetical protein
LTLVSWGERIDVDGMPGGQTHQPHGRSEMSDQERRTDEAEEEPEGKETISDLEISKQDAETVKGGIQDSEDRYSE